MRCGLGPRGVGRESLARRTAAGAMRQWRARIDARLRLTIALLVLRVARANAQPVEPEPKRIDGRADSSWRNEALVVPRLLLAPPRLLCVRSRVPWAEPRRGTSASTRSSTWWPRSPGGRGASAFDPPSSSRAISAPWSASAFSPTSCSAPRRRSPRHAAHERTRRAAPVDLFGPPHAQRSRRSRSSSTAATCTATICSSSASPASRHPARPCPPRASRSSRSTSSRASGLATRPDHAGRRGSVRLAALWRGSTHNGDHDIEQVYCQRRLTQCVPGEVDEAAGAGLRERHPVPARAHLRRASTRASRRSGLERLLRRPRRRLHAGHRRDRRALLSPLGVRRRQHQPVAAHPLPRLAALDRHAGADRRKRPVLRAPHPRWSRRSARLPPADRFRDYSTVLFNVEYRWPIWLWADAALFFDWAPPPASRAAASRSRAPPRSRRRAAHPHPEPVRDARAARRTASTTGSSSPSSRGLDHEAAGLAPRSVQRLRARALPRSADRLARARRSPRSRSRASDRSTACTAPRWTSWSSAARPLPATRLRRRGARTSTRSTRSATPAWFEDPRRDSPDHRWRPRAALARRDTPRRDGRPQDDPVLPLTVCKSQVESAARPASSRTTRAGSATSSSSTAGPGRPRDLDRGGGLAPVLGGGLAGARAVAHRRAPRAAALGARPQAQEQHRRPRAVHRGRCTTSCSSAPRASTARSASWSSRLIEGDNLGSFAFYGSARGRSQRPVPPREPARSARHGRLRRLGQRRGHAREQHARRLRGRARTRATSSTTSRTSGARSASGPAR